MHRLGRRNRQGSRAEKVIKQSYVQAVKANHRQMPYMVMILRLWSETSALLIDKSDEVTRVARNPKRKLSAADRLVSPANQLMQRGRKPSALARTIAAALKFDYAEDKEAVEI